MSKTLYLVHKTHLDIGFTDLAQTVVDQYLEHFIPSAIDLAQEMSDQPSDHPDDRFIWTTGSWLIHHALQQYTGKRLRRLEQAIEQHHVTWHALPFTFHTELLSRQLLRFGLSLSAWLDKRFDRHTTAAKMTDVPGHSLGLVPILADHDIQLLHLGCNPASLTPQLPSAFRWVLDDQGVYVIYDRQYGATQWLKDTDAGLSFLHTNDNLGPPSAEQVIHAHAYYRARFPQARVVSDSMQPVADLLKARKPEWPIIDQEIGDTWIHGVGSAPEKVADYCALRRCFESFGLPEPADVDRMDHQMAMAGLMVAEHTWGLDIKTHLGDHRHYTRDEIARIRRSARIRKVEQSWAEQQAYIHQLPCDHDHPASRQLHAALNDSRRMRRLPMPGRNATAVSERMDAGNWSLEAEPCTGTLTSLYYKPMALECCQHPSDSGLAEVVYDVYGAEDYRRWCRDYLRGEAPRWWSVEDFGRPGLPDHWRDGRRAALRCVGRWFESDQQTVTMTQHLQLSMEYQSETGMPELIGVAWQLDQRQAKAMVSIGWDHKPASRLPEAMWLGFDLPVSNDVTRSCWRLKKLGQWIDPTRVVADGGRNLHAIEQSARCQLPTGQSVTLDSFDAPLLAMDRPALLEVPGEPRGHSGRVWFNLFNNMWNTNFPQWIEGAMGYRFEITLQQSDGSPVQ